MTGYVYLIGNPTFGWYKIGKSITPEIRVQNIGVLLPFKIEVVGIWKSENHSRLEKHLHQTYDDFRINGEWFRFSKTQIQMLFDRLSEGVCVFRAKEHPESPFAKFSNIDRDCPEDSTIRFKIKKMRGKFTPHERNAIRLASMIEQAQKRLAAGKPITDAQQRVLQEHRVVPHPTTETVI